MLTTEPTSGRLLHLKHFEPSLKLAKIWQPLELSFFGGSKYLEEYFVGNVRFLRSNSVAESWDSYLVNILGHLWNHRKYLRF